MFGKTKGNGAMRYNAYSLAEVLVVMAIIMIIFLALPPVTKKVFKINDAQRAHGRFECFWDVDENGKKALFSYFSEENDNEPVLKKMTGNYCEFTPTANTLYYMIHAVGGGGAGAVIATQKDEDGNVTVDENLTPKNTKVQATSYLSRTAVNAWPTWINWFTNTNECENIPWRAKTSTGREYCPTKITKEQFDVNTVSDKQQLRYRLGGSAGKVVSSFVPQLLGNLTIKIYPGKGGTISRTNDGSGGSGEDTRIEYTYPHQDSIVAMRAAGGRGGDGSVDSRMTFTLVGGEPTDFMMSTKTSIAKKLSGFTDVIESSKTYKAMNSKVPTNAGDGGSGETQFVTETAGQILYEYDNNEGVWRYSRRYGSNWKNLTGKLGTKYYTEDNISTTANCGDKTLDSFELERSGYCDANKDASDSSKKVYICAIGSIPEPVISNIASIEPYKYPKWNTNKSSSFGTNNNQKIWQVFRVVKNMQTNSIESVTPMTNDTSTYISGGKVVYSDDYYYINNYYKTKKTPYYECYVNPNYITLHCKTTLKDSQDGMTNKVNIHNCTKENVSKYECSNGEQAMCSNGSSYSNCSDASKLKCPAHNGGDGAVVILW